MRFISTMKNAELLENVRKRKNLKIYLPGMRRPDQLPTPRMRERAVTCDPRRIRFLGLGGGRCDYIVSRTKIHTHPQSPPTMTA